MRIRSGSSGEVPHSRWHTVPQALYHWATNCGQGSKGQSSCICSILSVYHQIVHGNQKLGMSSASESILEACTNVCWPGNSILPHACFLIMTMPQAGAEDLYFHPEPCCCRLYI